MAKKKTEKKKEAPKKEAPKKKAAPKAKVPKDHVVVTVDKVLVDVESRPSVMIKMKDGTEAWLPKEMIKARDGKKFTIPKFLKEVKIKVRSKN